MTVHHMAIKLGHDKRQRANICKVTSLLATDHVYRTPFCLINVVTGVDLRKLNCEPQVNYICLLW